MSHLLKCLLVVLSLAALPVVAQEAPVDVQITSNEPSKVALAGLATASARVTGIDKSTRTVTLKRANGRSFDVVCGDEVKNFDQIRLGDEVVIRYVQALTLEVKKNSGLRERVEGTDSAQAAAGEKPAGAVGRTVTILADVIEVSPKKKTITVKGPRGNIVELAVENPEHFKVVKKGDQIQADYVEALAISVEPASR
ncbi:MAG: hypothetical protein QM739_15115 [Propionivibrio sp.]